MFTQLIKMLKRDWLFLLASAFLLFVVNFLVGVILSWAIRLAPAYTNDFVQGINGFLDLFWGLLWGMFCIVAPRVDFKKALGKFMLFVVLLFVLCIGDTLVGMGLNHFSKSISYNMNILLGVKEWLFFILTWVLISGLLIAFLKEKGEPAGNYLLKFLLSCVCVGVGLAVLLRGDFFLNHFLNAKLYVWPFERVSRLFTIKNYIFRYLYFFFFIFMIYGITAWMQSQKLRGVFSDFCVPNHTQVGSETVSRNV